MIELALADDSEPSEPLARFDKSVGNRQHVVNVGTGQKLRMKQVLKGTASNTFLKYSSCDLSIGGCFKEEATTQKSYPSPISRTTRRNYSIADRGQPNQ